MEAIILKCKPFTRFHLGNFTEERSNVLGNTATIIHSDVLFSALISILAARYPTKVKPFLQYFREGKLKISSGFYCIEDINNNSYIYLFPKPASLYLKPPKENPKLVKNIEFISWGVWANGILPEQWEQSTCKVYADQFVSMKDEMPDLPEGFQLYQKVDEPKVRVRTNTQQDNFYHQSDVMLMGNDQYRVHWYFLAEKQLIDEDQKIWQEILNALTYSGIGGERSTGSGKVDAIEQKPFDASEAQDSGYHASLSLTIPSDNEQKHFLIYRSLVRGGRFLEDDQRLQAVHMLEEGALQNANAYGKDVNIGQGYLRGGYNFSIPVHSNFILNIE